MPSKAAPKIRAPGAGAPDKRKAKTNKSADQSFQLPSRTSTRSTRTSLVGKHPFSKDDDDATDTVVDGQEDWTQGKTLVKPDDQLQLSEQELKEEFTRILTANNPHAPQNIVRYSFKDRQYKQIASVDQLAIHFSLDGNLLHKESDEGRRQLQKLGMADAASEHPEEAEEKPPAEQQQEGEPAEGAEGEQADEAKEGEGQAESGTPTATATADAGTGAKKITNQFNFSERASQTYNNPWRERGTATEPPPRATYSGNVTQWEIFDAYQEDFDKQGSFFQQWDSFGSSNNKEKNKEKKVVPGRKEEDPKKKKLTIVDSQSDDISRVARVSKIVERMTNQNTFDEVSQDFKYWEDISDEYREQEGTLLPLWKFCFEKSKKLAVTALSWSPRYMDLFVVGHGSYDFTKQTHGMVLMYTLKNPSYPEHIIETKSGVLCLDNHPEYPNLIAVGFYDGSVGVINVKDSENAMKYLSTAKTGKHTDPVWQVRWQKEDLDNNLNFCSVSSDGRVSHWTVIKNELRCTDIIKLTLEDQSSEGPDGTKLVSVGGGTALDFHQDKDYQFLVGTEEGHVHLCSTAYSSTFMETYHAHHMAIYRTQWNLYQKNLFITCSDDWSVKIWDITQKKKEPLFTFDLNSPVGDVAWAPYSSTVFAAVTADGKVHIFDLSVNKYEAICEQLVIPKKKTKLTHIAFNPKYFIVVVGDDRGYTTCLKLSPNLRKVQKEKKGQENVKSAEKEAARVEFELNKIEKLLAMVRQVDSKEKKPTTT